MVEDSTSLEITFINEKSFEAVVKGVDADMDLPRAQEAEPSRFRCCSPVKADPCPAVPHKTHLEITFINEKSFEAVVKGVDADMDLAVVAVPLSSLDDATRDAITVARLGA